jgi:putative transcriptional regulator
MARMQEAIGRRIKRLRTQAGLKQAALANAAGVSGSAISQIESGSTAAPKPVHLLQIARVLGVPLEWLIEPQTKRLGEAFALYPRVLSRRAYDLARWFDALSGDDQKKAIGVLMAYGPAISDKRVAQVLLSTAHVGAHKHTAETDT